MNNKLSFVNKILSNYGIGKKLATNLFKNSGLNIRNNPKSVKTKQLNDIDKKLKSFQLGKKLKDNTKEIINFLTKIKTYKGVRHKLKYPVRGQRTHTNAKTKKSQL